MHDILEILNKSPINKMKRICNGGKGLSITLISILLSACEQPGGGALTGEEIARIEAMQNPFEQPVQRLRKPGEIQGIPFAIDDCRIYRGKQTKSGVITQWQVVIDADTDPFMDCDEESLSITFEKGYLIAEIVALGYYSRNGVYIDYRTNDGRVWQVREKTIKRTSSIGYEFVEGPWLSMQEFSKRKTTPE